MFNKLIIYTDGGARGNPGPAGLGVVIKEEDKVIYQHGQYLGEQTNNYAEYSALIHALEKSKELGAEILDIRMDSELIVKQMQGKYKIKNEQLKLLAAQVLKLLNSFKSYSFTHVLREYNKEADSMVNQAIDNALTDGKA